MLNFSESPSSVESQFLEMLWEEKIETSKRIITALVLELIDKISRFDTENKWPDEFERENMGAFLGLWIMGTFWKKIIVLKNRDKEEVMIIKENMAIFSTLVEDIISKSTLEEDYKYWLWCLLRGIYPNAWFWSQSTYGTQFADAARLKNSRTATDSDLINNSNNVFLSEDTLKTPASERTWLSFWLEWMENLNIQELREKDIPYTDIIRYYAMNRVLKIMENSFIINK